MSQFFPIFMAHAVEHTDRRISGMYIVDDFGNLYQVISTAELPHPDMLFHRTLQFALSGKRDWYVDAEC